MRDLIDDTRTLVVAFLRDDFMFDGSDVIEDILELLKEHPHSPDYGFSDEQREWGGRVYMSARDWLRAMGTKLERGEVYFSG